MPCFKACQSNSGDFTGKLQNTDKKQKYAHTTLEKGGRYEAENRAKTKTKLDLPLPLLSGGAAGGRADTDGVVLRDVLSTEYAEGGDARGPRPTGETV